MTAGPDLPIDDSAGRPSRWGRCRSSPWSGDPTWASRRWSTASSAAARPSSRTSPASPATGCRTTPTGTAGRSPSWTPAAGTPTRGAWPHDRGPGRASRSTLADAVLFVVDATVGITDGDAAVVKILRQSGQARRARGEQGRRPAHRGRGLRAVEPRARRAVPRLGAARPRLRRHARRRPRGAPGDAAGEDRRAGRRPAPDRDRRASRTSASPRC